MKSLEFFIIEKFKLDPGWEHYNRLVDSLTKIEVRHNPNHEEEFRIWQGGSWLKADIDSVLDMPDEDAAALNRAFS